MPRINPARRVILSKEERALLRQWTLAGHAPRQLAARAQMVLAEEQGKSRRQIARELQMASGTVRKWCTRFATLRMGGLVDRPRPGAPRLITDAVVQAIVTRTLAGRSDPSNRCTSRRLARSLGVSQTAVMRIWRRFGLAKSDR